MYHVCTLGFSFLGLLFQGVTVHAEDQSQQILSRALEAHGAQKLAKYPAATWKGKGVIHLTGMRIPFTGEWASAGLDKMRIELQMEIGGDKLRVVNIYDGKMGWTVFGEEVNDFDDEALAEMKELTHVNWAQNLHPLKDPSYKLTEVPGIQFEGKALVGFKVSRAGFRDFTFYFDAKSNLLVKCTCQVRDEETREFVTQEEFYGKYEIVSGIKIPMSLRIKRGSKEFLEADTTTFTPQENLDGKLFQKPGK